MIVCYGCAIFCLLFSLFLTQKSFRLLRLRRELRTLGQQSTPRVDDAATFLSLASALSSIVCVTALVLLLLNFLHLQTQVVFVIAFFAVARWIDVATRHDKIVCPSKLHWASDMAVQFTTTALLSTACTLVAIPLAALPLAMQLLFVIVSSWMGVSAVWQWRERTVHQGAFNGADAVERREVAGQAMRRYLVVYSIVLSLFGVLDWMMAMGLVPRDGRIWLGAILFSFFFSDFFATIFAQFGESPTKQRAKQALRR